MCISKVKPAASSIGQFSVSWSSVLCPLYSGLVSPLTVRKNTALHAVEEEVGGQLFILVAGHVGLDGLDFGEP